MDCCIRLFCHRLTRKQRKIVTTTAFLLFLTACLHAILASLSGLGELGGKMKIEYVRPLDLRPEKSKRLLNYILCIRFFSGMHSIVSASQFPYTNLSQGCH